MFPASAMLSCSNGIKGITGSLSTLFLIERNIYHKKGFLTKLFCCNINESQFRVRKGSWNPDSDRDVFVLLVITASILSV